jgi:hypothetical protein
VRVTSVYDVRTSAQFICYLLSAIRERAESEFAPLLLAVDGVVEDSQVFLDNVRR